MDSITLFVAKHHDGFSNYPSKFSDYNIANTPHCRTHDDQSCDITRRYIMSMRKSRLYVGIYFSAWDRQFSSTLGNNGRNSDYIVRLQIHELLTKYGDIDILWLDGLGWQLDEVSDVNYKELRNWISQVSPETIVVNNNHKGGVNSDIPIYEGYESFLSSKQNTLPAEVCDRISVRPEWFYVEGEKTRPSAEINRLLSKTRIRRQNTLINIGPTKELLLPKQHMCALKNIQRRNNAIDFMKDPDLSRITTPQITISPTKGIISNDIEILSDNLPQNQDIFCSSIYVFPGDDIYVRLNGLFRLDSISLQGYGISSGEKKPLRFEVSTFSSELEMGSQKREDILEKAPNEEPWSVAYLNKSYYYSLKIKVLERPSFISEIAIRKSDYFEAFSPLTEGDSLISDH